MVFTPLAPPAPAPTIRTSTIFAPAGFVQVNEPEEDGPPKVWMSTLCVSMASCVKAVVAICVVSVVADAEGAVGVPVSAGEASGA